MERVLGELDGVEEISVFGVDDERRGRRVCAAAVGEVSEQAFDSLTRDHLAPAKRPKEYHRLGELSRTPTRKVRRLDLSDTVAGS